MSFGARVVLVAASTGVVLVAEFLGASTVGSDNAEHAVRLPAVATSASSTVTVDVLIVFSEARSRDAPVRSAENWISQANWMHKISRSPVRLRLADWRVARGQTAAMMAGFENRTLGDRDREQLLVHMREETAEDRNSVGADVVLGVGKLSVQPFRSYGWAWGYDRGAAGAMAFVLDDHGSASSDRWRGTARVIAHEIGHLLGLGHGDRDGCDGRAQHLPYACAVDGRIATVMSTEGFKNWWSPLFSTTGRIDYPEWPHTVPGDARHDNVRAMRETAHVVASYRGRSWAPVPEPGPKPEPEPEPTPDNCRPGRTCLENGFAVRVNWTTDGGRTIGTGKLAAHLGDDSAAFWFFDPNNAEVLLKVLDGCAVNRHWWVYAAPATDVEYWVSVWPPDGIARPDGVAYRGYQQPTARTHETDPDSTWVAAITDTEAFRCRQ